MEIENPEIDFLSYSYLCSLENISMPLRICMPSLKTIDYKFLKKTERNNKKAR